MQESYEILRDVISERTNPVIAWVGSGLSSPAGLPTWKQLRNRLCEAFTAKASLMTDSTEKLKLLGMVKKAKEHNNLWVAFGVLHEAGLTTYASTIREAFKESQRCSVPETYIKL